MKHTLLGIKSLLLVFLISCIADAWGETFNTTYNYAGINAVPATWNLTNKEDGGSYWRIPTDDNTYSVATFSNIFSEKSISSDIIVTINCATYGSGTNPSSSSFSLYTSLACTSQISATQGGTLPTSSTYTNITYTIAKANTNSLSNDLAIKITKPGKQIRLKSVNIQFTYTNDDDPIPSPISHDVTFSINGSSKTDSYNEGDGIIIPSAPNDIFGKKFIGWTTNPILEETDDKPELVTPAATMGDADRTYYAVYATVQSEAWSRITTLTDIADGTYVIINGGYVLPNTTTGGSTPPTAISAPTTDESTITENPSEDMKWQFSSTGEENQFYIKNTENNYLYETNNNNGLRVGSTNDSWTFEINNVGYFAMKGSKNNRYCAKYKDGSDWRSYTTANATNYANGGKIELYKFSSIYSGYCTIITTPAFDMVADFYESFDTNIGSGGNDGRWNGDIASNDIKSVHIGWSFSNGSGANQCIKLGTGSKKGSATTPVISFSGTAVISFKAATWDGSDEKTNINIIASQGDLSQASVSLKKGEWGSFTIIIRNVVASTQITFEANTANNNRFFLDEVRVTQKGNLSLAAQTDDSYYTTFSRPYDVQMEDDIAVYSIIEYNDGIGFCKIASNKIPANTGALLRSKSTGPYTYNIIGSADNFAGNLLRPASAAMTGSFRFYKLAYDNYTNHTGLGFYYGAAEGGSFVCKEGTAYLAIPNGASASRMRSFSFDDMDEATSIEEIANSSSMSTETIYTLSGLRVGHTAKGLYVVNGKKVLKF